MSKQAKKEKRRRTPPRFRRLKVGQIWHVKKAAGHPVLTGQVDEVTPDTIVLRWLDDGAIQVKPTVLPIRWDRKDWIFVEKVA